MRKIFVLFVVLFMLLVLTACGGDEAIPTDDSSKVTTSTQESTTSTTGTQASTPPITVPTETTTPQTVPPHAHSYTPTMIKAATCTEKGYTTYTCSCGHSYTADYIDPKNHIEGVWIIDKEATFASPGKQHKECSTCGEIIKSETIPQKTCPHSATTWVIDVEATFETEGSKSLVCHTCGETIKSESIPKLQLPQSQITEKLKQSIVKVICYDYDGTTEMSQGSGFFIDEKGTFITNAHVVEGCYYIKIQSYLGATYDVDVMYEYNGTISDYAICSAKNYIASKPVEFVTTAAVGDTVYALGYPNDAFILSTTSGKITSTDTVDGTKHYYANTAWIDHGSSGGVLVDSQGRVLGITTGIFSDGEYAALKYQDFKFDAEGIHVGSKEPLEYFHTVDEVWLASYNMNDYFDVIVNATATSDTHVSYQVTVQLKDKYKSAKFLIDSASISVTLKLDTKYDYKEVVSYGTSNKTKNDSTYLYFRFWNEGNLITGDTQYATSSIFVSSYTEYYGMDISYDVDFSGGNGTLIIYDKNEL